MGDSWGHWIRAEALFSSAIPEFVNVNVRKGRRKEKMRKIKNKN